MEAIPLPAKGDRSVLWDTDLKGFGVRVTSTGARTYVLRYRMGGRSTPLRVVTIGRHGSPWTTEQARRRAAELLGQVRSGIDIVGERTKAREDDAEAARTREERMFEALADRWFKRHVQRERLRSEADIEGVVRRDLKPAFADKSIDEITKEDVTAALEQIGGRSPDAANKAFKWLRKMFNWFIGKGLIAASPLDRMKMPFPETRRKRVLKLREVVVLWVALDALPDPFRTFYRLLILLGQRLREVSNLPWSELDLDGGDWIIPGARTKNKLDHLVPMSEQAITLLETIKPDAESRRGPVITTNGKVGISGFSKLKERVDEAATDLIRGNALARELVGDELDDWVVHDLRRTLATGCQGTGTALEVTEAVLNHISGSRGGIVGVYQLYEYYDEKADALQRWADLIDKALECWARGDAEGIRELEPGRRTRRRRRTLPDG